MKSLLPLRCALHFAGTLDKLARLFARKSVDPGPWCAGISVIIPERASPGMLRECLRSAVSAAARLEEAAEIIVVVNGAPLSDYAEIRSEFPTVRWLHRSEPLSFSAAVALGVKHARYGGVYLLNSDMVLDPAALAEAARWRAPHVFAVASQIFFADPDRRREETGWTDFRLEGPHVRIFDALPEDETVRGTLYAGGGASLFRRELLEGMLGSDPYAPFYWEDVEWGVRAWRDGFESLFCPHSRAVHRHRATVSRFYEPAEIERIFCRNALLFELRHGLTGTAPPAVISCISAGPAPTRRELSSLRVATAVLFARLAKSRAPHPDVPLIGCCRKFYLRPPESGLRRPRLLLVSPYHILPPEHGGARRIASLIERLGRTFEIHLLSDEGSRYRASQLAKYSGVLSSIHLVTGRPDAGIAPGDRIARIRAHSHTALRGEMQRIIDAYRPAIVQIEYVELAALGAQIGPGPRRFLTLHDVLLTESGNSAEDAFELALMRRYDGLFTCCPEDAALLRCPNVLVVPNGVEWSGRSYRPSRGHTSLLFIGPFRYPPNLAAMLAFASAVFPRLREEMPGVRLDILGGVDAERYAQQHPCLSQPGIEIHGHTDDVYSWLENCALTINPLCGNRGSAIKVAESVVAGRVCVSTREGARGFLDGGIPGLVVVESVAGLLHPIRHLLANEEERLRLEVPPPWLAEQVSWSRSAALQEAIYRRALSGAHFDSLEPET